MNFIHVVKAPPFLVLGSASIDLLKQSSESLAGRIRYLELAPLDTLDLVEDDHDLRRTAATRMAAAGISREHIAHVLNHVDGGPRATLVYDWYSYDREKTVALETWARVLRGVVEKGVAANVVPFVRAGSA